ncbi:MAG: hypothetical protein AAF791_02675 [Bacteroidota bacterium]
MNRDDSFALLVSLGVHALLLLLFVTVALDSRQELESPAPRFVEVEFAQVPIRPVLAGPTQRAEAGERSAQRQSLEPERPAPPATTPVRPPERPRPTPPRETPPIPRSSPQPEAPPQRPSPPSRQTQPEPDPTPPQQPEPSQGTGVGGEGTRDGRADTGTREGSGGDAPVEVSFGSGTRGYSCNASSIPPAPQGGGRIQLRLTFNSGGRLVRVSAAGRRDTALENHIERYLRCSADRIGSGAGNQSIVATFTVR